MASCLELEEITTKQKLSKLNCLFTWEILDSVIKRAAIIDDVEDDNFDEGLYPLELLVKYLFKCYKAVISADDERTWMLLIKAEELLMQLQQEPEFSRIIRAIEHVFYATKCFVLYEAQKMEELEEILQNINDTDDFNNAETGALYGCESIVWSCLNHFGFDKALEMAKKALETNEDCALWHFIIAKSLRCKRRLIQLSSSPSEMEEEHFGLAYAIANNNPVFGIYYLQMRIEKYFKFIKDQDYAKRKAENEKEVMKMAKKILKQKPNSYNVLINLALMFIRSNSSDESASAKECLKAVEKISPNSSTYLHYCGMLHEDCGEFREALQFYKKAAECNNFVAELAYVRYGWETGELQPLPHLLRMVEKYRQTIKEQQILLFLSIAATYYSIHDDIPAAAKYFLKALTVDPLSQKFKMSFKFLDFNVPSIINFLKNYFLPKTARLQNNNLVLKQTCKKIRRLLDEKSEYIGTEEIRHLFLDGAEYFKNWEEFRHLSAGGIKYSQNSKEIRQLSLHRAEQSENLEEIRQLSQDGEEQSENSEEIQQLSLDRAEQSENLEEIRQLSLDEAEQSDNSEEIRQLSWDRAEQSENLEEIRQLSQDEAEDTEKLNTD